MTHQVHPCTADEETELTAVETKLSGCEPELRTPRWTPSLPLPKMTRARTVGDDRPREPRTAGTAGQDGYRRLSQGGGRRHGGHGRGGRVCGVVRRPGRCGHLPMAIFAGTTPTVETRAITPGPAVKGMLQPTVPFVFERSAAASLGIIMPTVPDGPGTDPERSRPLHRLTRWQKTARHRRRLRRSRL